MGLESYFDFADNDREFLTLITMQAEMITQWEVLRKIFANDILNT